MWIPFGSNRSFVLYTSDCLGSELLGDRDQIFIMFIITSNSWHLAHSGQSGTA